MTSAPTGQDSAPTTSSPLALEIAGLDVVTPSAVGAGQADRFVVRDAGRDPPQLFMRGLRPLILVSRFQTVDG